MARIFYISSEVTPFAASGGLGDVLGALPVAVRRILGKGCEVGVLMPLYASVSDEARRGMRPLHSGETSLAWRRVPYRVLTLRRRGVDFYFIDCPRCFDRPAMYGEYDDGERFAVFCRAALDFMQASGRVPDVLHANDWQSALAVIYPRTLLRGEDAFSRMRTVFTIHNMAYQGIFDPAILSDVFDVHPMHRELLEYGGRINLMKGAMVLSDAVGTVSRRYAREIAEDTYGEGLASLIRAGFCTPFGVINGLDTAYFNPAALPIPYGVGNATEGKRANKRVLLSEMSLTYRKSRPLVAFIGRLVPDKGMDILMDAIPAILALGADIAVLGTGEPSYEAALSSLAEEHRSHMRFFPCFDRDLSKRLYASADVFLMPSRREPCGLAQMAACRYGAIPVVHATGGLADTIIPYGRQGGNGFVFSEYSAGELALGAGDAIELYRKDTAAWERLVRQAMRTDFGWHRPALEYISVYRRISASI